MIYGDAWCVLDLRQGTYAANEFLNISPVWAFPSMERIKQFQKSAKIQELYFLAEKANLGTLLIDTFNVSRNLSLWSTL